jgi:hypothetical protein
LLQGKLLCAAGEAMTTGLQMGRWDVQVFIQNLTNTSAATWISALPEYPSAYRLRPRTAGVNFRYALGVADQGLAETVLQFTLDGLGIGF